MTRRGLILFFLFYNRGQNNFRNNIAKKIQSPEVGREIKSVSWIKLSFDGNQVYNISKRMLVCQSVSPAFKVASIKLS